MTFILASYRIELSKQHHLVRLDPVDTWELQSAVEI